MRLKLSKASRRGSVFILVLWISFGLVVLSLYFANSMSFELKAADNRFAAVQAQQAINGAARYASYVISTFATNGVVPDLQAYHSEWVPVGEASFWFLGQVVDEQVRSETIPAFGLVDEASKLNLNTANFEMLQGLPGMTGEFAAAIIDWRDTNAELSENGAEDENYQRLNPPRRCKNAPFESVDELRLVYGATLELIYGEDANRNGILDASENDGDISLPLDNRDGHLDQGISAYVTVHSRQTNTRADGSPRVNVSNGNNANLNQLLTDTFGSERAGEITANLQGQFTSVLQFYVRSGTTADEFAQIEDAITTSNQSVTQGLVNVNTASEVVLSCIPGIGEAKAATMVAHRASNPSHLSSIAWVKDVLDTATIQQAGRFLTGRTYQFSADVVAVGRFNRGFRRTRFVIDSSEATPRIVYRQDFTPLGWALGLQVRENLQLELRSRL